MTALVQADRAVLERPARQPSADVRPRIRRLGLRKPVPLAAGSGIVLLLAVWTAGSAAGLIDPKDATDLPLPPDGRLLLFVSLDETDGDGNCGQVIYVPAGTAIEERDKNTWSGYPGDDHYQKIVDSYPQGELRARTEPDLPYHTLPGFPNADELVTLWCDAVGRSGHLQVGGYADQEDSDPDPLERLAIRAAREAKHRRWGGDEPVSGAVEDWVLLAHWNPDISDREGADVQWGIQRADLEARRFDRTFSTVYWNP